MIIKDLFLKIPLGTFFFLAIGAKLGDKYLFVKEK